MNLKVEKHQKGGQFKFDPNRVQLYLTDLQKEFASVVGDVLYKRLRNKPVLNANVLDYLLAHPYLIPKNWKRKKKDSIYFIYFWGTIYRLPCNSLIVRFLCWDDIGLASGVRQLNDTWYDNDPAALLAA